MSQVGLTMTQPDPQGQPPKRGKSRAAVLLAFVVVVAIVGVVGWIGYNTFIKAAPDYSGEGTGSVMVKIEQGQTIASMGETLQSKDVVLSAKAFVDAASSDPKAKSIQPGFYQMREKMSATAALAVLTDPKNKAGLVIIPEGTRANKVAEIASAATGTPLADYEAVINDPSKIGLPSWGKNHIEGFLFPASYDFAPGTSATAQFTAMVTRFKAEAAKIQLEKQATARGMSPYDVLIVASIVQAEAQPADFDKVARVIYNRLACTLPACKTEYIQGRLQMDSTINYAQNSADLNLSAAELSADGPYNTHKNKGLPPTPIDNPGTDAILAALNPAAGDWLYFVSDQDFTQFSDTFEQQKQAEQKWRESKQ